MTLTVQLFGPYAAAAGRQVLLLDCGDVASVTAAEVMVKISSECAALKSILSTAKLAVNCDYVAHDHHVHEADELALIGMVGGG